MNSKLHAVCDSEGRPRSLFLTAGQVSDYTGAAALLSSLPPAKALLADKDYDADWFRETLSDRNYEICIPSKSNRKIQIPHDRALYRKRHRIENMFGKMKDWRRIHTRCAHTFMSAITIAAVVIFWICSMSPEPNTLGRNFCNSFLSSQNRNLVRIIDPVWLLSYPNRYPMRSKR